MSKQTAEEIAREIINEYTPGVVSGSHIERYSELAIMEMMKDYHTQKLQELEEAVRKINCSGDTFYGHGARKKALQLITKAKDDE